MKLENQQELVEVVCETILTETRGAKMELVKNEGVCAKTVDAFHGLDREKIDLLKSTICKGASDNELQLFLIVAKSAGLDPFFKQIYALPIGGKFVNVVSIDGLRLLADRTNKYLPGADTKYTYDEQGKLFSAEAFVSKFSQGGWHQRSVSVKWKEYCPVDSYNRPKGLWATKPETMLSKVAEPHCLRKCFPAEMRGLYTQEELDAADNPDTIEINAHVVKEEKKKQIAKSKTQIIEDEKQEPEAASTISNSEAALLRTLLRHNAADEKTLVVTKKIERLEELPKVQYESVLKRCQKRYDQITVEREKQLEAKKAEIALAAQDGELVAIDTGAEIDVGF